MLNNVTDGPEALLLVVLTGLNRPNDSPSFVVDMPLVFEVFDFGGMKISHDYSCCWVADYQYRAFWKTVPMDGEMLAAVIRWSGVGVALAGAVLTSPDGAKRLWQGLVLQIRELFGRTHENATASAHSINSNLGARSHVKAELMWGPDSPLEHRIDILLGRIEGLSAELAEAKSEMTTRLDQHEQKLASLTNAIHDARQELHQLILANEDRAAQVDAFGLPVIGLGIFLSGVPEDLAAVPWLGVSLTYISLYATFVVALLGIRRGAWSGKLS